MSNEPGQLFGTFSEPGNLAVGDPYSKPPATKLPRHSGKQFVTAPPKAGRAPDAYLDKTVRSLGEGAPYTDAWILQSRMARAPGKPLSDKPFVTLLGRRGCVSTGPGALNGTLGEVPLDTDGSAAAKKSAPPRRPADKLRNMYTRGPKTGGFGRPWQDRSLGEPPKYWSDVYDGGRQKEKEMAAAAKAVSVKPFVGASAPRRTLGPDAFLAPPPAATPGRKSGGDGGDASSGEAGGEARSKSQLPAWRAGGPPKKGTATFSQVGRDFVPCPVYEATFHAKGDSPKPFKPVGSCHKRLSMWAPNVYALEARAAPDIDFTLFATR